MRSAAIALLGAVALALPAAAGAEFAPGEEPPELCRGDFWSDRVGTDDVDFIVGVRRAERIYGLGGDDWLIGSPNRASCLLGGRGSDILTVSRGGGVAFGEAGADLIDGSSKTDFLEGGGGEDRLVGGDGADTISGDGGRDYVEAEGGDDEIHTRDGVPEVVSCGLGADTVTADRRDVLLDCEKWTVTGKSLRTRRLNRRVGDRTARFRLPFTAKRDSPPLAYRVIVDAPGCTGGPFEVATSPPLRAGQRTRLVIAPERRRWCPGSYSGALVYARECRAREACDAEPPPKPLGRLSFVIR